MEFIEAKHSEQCDWRAELVKHRLNKGDPVCMLVNECWEYMGSTHDHHHFRHLHHPLSGKREFIYFERHRATLVWAEDLLI